MIETDASGTKYIKWTAPAGVVGLTSKTLMMWINPDDFGAGYEPFLIYSATTTEELNSFSTVITTGKFGWVARFSTTNGVWLTSTATLTAGAWNHVAITYNGSATTNDPLFYLNGANVTTTETSTPVGTYRAGTTTDVHIGSLTSGSNLDGKTASCLVYNRILSAAEILDAYNSKLAIPDWRGLVFAPNLSGAAGIQTFDGATLGASNTIADQVSGALGTPSGDPVGRGDTYLIYNNQ